MAGPKQKTYRGWHFLKAPGRLRDGSPAMPAGKVEFFHGDLLMCERGLHASSQLIDALSYAPGTYLREVVLSGELLISGNKACATQRKIVRELEFRPALVKFAAWCALRAKKHATACRGADYAASAAHAANCTAHAANCTARAANAADYANYAANYAARAANYADYAADAARTTERDLQNEKLLSLLSQPKRAKKK